MKTIWTPTSQRSRLSIPAGDVSLQVAGPAAAERTLRFVGPWPDDYTLRETARYLSCSLAEARRHAQEAIEIGGYWIENPLPPETPGDIGLKVLASVERTPHGTLLHVSTSYDNRDPDWYEIRAIREAFFPLDLDAMMVLPRAEDYVNIHHHTFHLWQTPSEWGMR